MIALGIDQARRSGWGVADARTVVAHGVAASHRERLAVLELVRARNGGTLAGALVVFEDHSGMPLGRLGRGDHTSRRSSGREGAVERSTASVLGMGAARGRWDELLDMLEHPAAHRMSVEPRVWRAALGISARASTDEAKRQARLVASSIVGAPVEDDDEAEGVCLAAWAGVHAHIRDAARKAEQRVHARARAARARQAELDLGGRR